MKRVFNLILFVVLPWMTFAQWEVGVDLGALISHTDKSDEQIFTVERSAAFVPELRGGYTFGSKSQWNVNMGVSYFTKRYQLEPTALWQGERPDAIKFHYFSLPVMLTYRIPMSKFWLGLSCGMQADFFINQKTPELTYNDATFQRYQLDNKEMNQGFDFLAGAEFGYVLNDNWKFLLSYRHVFDLVKADSRNFHGKFGEDIISLGFRYIFPDVVTVESYDE